MEFFKQPQEEKEKYANDPSIGKFEGYEIKMTKNLDEEVEWVDYFFHTMSLTSKVDYQIWPQIPSFYKYGNQSPPSPCMVACFCLILSFFRFMFETRPHNNSILLCIHPQG